MTRMYKAIIAMLLAISMIIPTTVFAADNQNLDQSIHNAFESFKKL